MQRNDVRHHQAQQYQGHGNHVEAEEPVQGGISHHEVAANQQRQVWANYRHSREQIHDHLSAPVGHLAPRQQVTHESFGHEHQEDAATEDPNQFAGLAVRAVHQTPEHVQVHHNEER